MEVFQLDCVENRKKSLWKHAKEFVMINDQLYYKKTRKVIIEDEEKEKKSMIAILRDMVGKWGLIRHLQNFLNASIGEI